MKFTILFTIILIILSQSTFTQARSMTSLEMESDLNQLVSRIKSGYGPLQYKESNFGISVDALHTKYLKKLATTRSSSDFYYLIVKFVAEFKDSHFAAQVPTTHQSYLGFTTDLIEGKVLIDEIDRKVLSESIFPFVKGDEVVSMNGQSAETIMTELMENIGSGYALTQRRAAAMNLPLRKGATFQTPKGTTRIKIRRGISNVFDEVSLNWIEKGDVIDEVSPFEATSHSAQIMRDFRDFNDLSLGLTDGYFPKTERSFRCSGKTRTAIPDGATILIEDPFVAYYHATPHGNIGYLRIPHYHWVNDTTGKDEYELRFSQYEYILSVLEKNTLGLVIDQDHNCGGSVEFLEHLVSLFMPTPVKPMQFQLLANKEEYLSFHEWMTNLNSNTLAYQNLKNVLDTIQKSWGRGDFMTPLSSITGQTDISPNLIRYSKPIVMLIDELSGSGGDAFPSIMKGNGRAKLIGTRTMGAGGHIADQPSLFFSQIKIKMTKSLFFRPDGVAVENNGAVPDFEYQPTRDDFLYQYRPYQKFYTEKLFELLKP